MVSPAFLRCVIASIALLAAACGKKTSNETGNEARPGSAAASAAATAAGPIKIGLVTSLSGPFAEIGKLIQNGIKTYIHQHGDTVAGRKIEIITRDTTGPVGEVTRRVTQELAVQDKVDFLVGFGFTPEAAAAAPVATEAKIPMVIMNAATSMLTAKSPYIVRFSMTLAQVSAPLGEWAAKNGIHKVTTLVVDYGPGHEAEAAFTRTFTAAGGQIIETVRTPLNSPDFSSYVQRVKDSHPDAVFVFVPAGEQSLAVMKELRERGLADAGIKLIATGDVLDDRGLETIGDPALGVITTHHYSITHDSPENKAFLAAYREANGPEAGLPNFMSVAAYDGMAAIYEVIKKLDGKLDPEHRDQEMELFKHMAFTSPRGPIAIDPATRDIIQTVYLRRVDKVGGALRSVELSAFPDQKDPGK